MADILKQPSGREMQDSDIAELKADMVDAEDEQSELQEQEVGDLPETASEPEGDEPEPKEVGETEIERLTRLGLYRQGMIESFDDLGKSYKQLETQFSQTRPQQPEPQTQQPQADGPAVYQEILDSIASGDPAQQANAIYKISQIQTSGQANELGDLRRKVHFASNPDAAEYESQISDTQTKYPGMSIDDAFAMVKGHNMDSFVSNAKNTATQTEKARNLQKQAASREKPGGVRTAPASKEQGILNAMKGKSGTAAVEAMGGYLDSIGKGYKDT